MSEPSPLLKAQAEPDRRPGRWGWLAAGIWLFYLAQPLGEITQHSHGLERAVGLVALVAFAASYLTYFTWARRLTGGSRRSAVQWRLGFLAGMLGLAALTVPAAGQTALTCLVYVVALAMMSLDLRAALAITLLLLATAELSVRLVPGWDDTGYGLAVVLGALAVFGIRRAMQRTVELAETRKDMAELAVQEERNRFARDLHDILGHSLTVITVKAELAGRLIDQHPDRAAAEVADVEKLARSALADVRAAVAGYRELSLAGELVSARAALQAADIRADLPTTVDEVPERARELFAWVVREGVTNVIRHSGAKCCRVLISATGIEVTDDGRGPTATAPSHAEPQDAGPAEPRPVAGHGLIGLRERVAQAGARVLVGTSAEGGFRLAVRLTP